MEQVILDIEIYPNYLLIAMKHIQKNKYMCFEAIGYDSLLSETDMRNISRIINSYEIITFNGNNFDIPLLLAALKSYKVSEIKDMCNRIILDSIPGWQLQKEYNLKLPWDVKHIDIRASAPDRFAGLKIYGARMHSQKLQDLPYDPETELTLEQINHVREYCKNDLETTQDLLNNIVGSIEIRRDMVEKYGWYIVNKSDAQIAEVVLKDGLKNKGITIPEPEQSQQYYVYEKPDYIKFKTPLLKELLENMCDVEFHIDSNGYLISPSVLENPIKINKLEYQLGIGGLHSKEKSVNYHKDDKHVIIDCDVTSYYPFIIINNGFYPKKLTSEFINIFNQIVEDRIDAKKKSLDLLQGALKIVINGTFGKFGSKYSFLYSPQLLLNVTLTGQLSLLMLIEALENNGIEIISANTDGIVSKIPVDKKPTYNKICNAWQEITKYNLEFCEYRSIYLKDVNNYLAIKPDGKTKGKGVFADQGLRSTPSGDISSIAVIQYLKNNTDIEEFIKINNKKTDFLYCQKSKDGCYYKGEYLGKVARWVISSSKEAIYSGKVNHLGNSNKLPNSDNAIPIMDLSLLDQIDINYDYYINKSYDILCSLGLDDPRSPKLI